VAACISFIEMLGVKSEKARLHVTAGFLILKNITNATTKDAIGKYFYLRRFQVKFNVQKITHCVTPDIKKEPETGYYFQEFLILWILQ
jgi:hypothetical protein